MEEPLLNDKFLLEKYPGKGGWTYVTIPKIAEEKGSPFGWVKVCGTIDGYAIKNYRIMPMGSDKLFLPVKAGIRKIIKKKEGDYVEVILFADNSPMEIPEDLKLCLLDEPAIYKTFLACTDGEKKEYIDWIYTAKKEETRVARIAAVLKKLEHKQAQEAYPNYLHTLDVFLL